MTRSHLPRGGDAGQGPGHRRSAPGEATSAEASYLRQALRTKSTLVLHLMRGGELTGRLEFYDRDSLLVRPDGDAPILIRKEQVKYYWAVREAREEPAGAPRKAAAKKARGKNKRSR